MEFDLTAAIQGMLAQNVDPTQALSLIQQATDPKVDESLLINDLKATHPGLKDDEYRVLFNQKYPIPSEDEDDDDATTKEISRRAAIAKDLAARKQQLIDEARQKVSQYLPDKDAANRRAEKAKEWMTPLQASISEGKIEIEEGIAISVPKDPEAYKVFMQNVTDFAVQQGLEIGQEIPEALKDQMVRLALAFEGAAGYKAAIKDAVAKAREELIREYASGQTMGRPISPPAAKNLPKVSGGFV
jgi:hypothetical protein